MPSQKLNRGSFKIPDKNEVYVFAFDLIAGLNCLKEFETFLSNEEIVKANRFHFEKDKNNYIISHGILRKILSLLLSVKPSEINFGTNEYGKPFVQNPSNVQFNISHSKEKLLLAVSREVPVGVDIEFMNVEFASGDIAQNFFSPVEIQKLNKLEDDKLTEGFYNCWTRKEAFIKGIGKGLSIPLDSFDVELTPGLKPEILDVRFDKSENGKWELVNLDIYGEYKSALSVKMKMLKIELFKLENCCEVLSYT